MKKTKEKIIQQIAGWIPGILTALFFIKIQNVYHRMTSEKAAIGIGVFLLMIWGLVYWKTENWKYVIYRAVLLFLCFGAVCIYRWHPAFIKAFLLSLILSGIIWHILRHIRKDFKRIFPRTILCIGILAMMISCNCYLLYGRSIQDYRSIYEIESAESPDQKYTASSYMYENTGDSYTVFVRLKNKQSGKEKNIFLAKQENLDVRMKWLSGEMIQINNRKISIHAFE